MVERGEVFYSSYSPRITFGEYEELLALGFKVQCEWPHPPESKMYYQMDILLIHCSNWEDPTGIITHIHNLAKAINIKGHNVTIIARGITRGFIKA
jgi:hypothetical protein